MDLHFYKAWDVFGALSNFAPFQISMPSGPSGTEEKWSTLEHYYQAYKFKGVEAAADTCAAFSASRMPTELSFCTACPMGY
jgi:diaminohydroxyphosphoribosylaminopyrimidine deaminase/5-amino-6-(5-phosphoribosylamino)uracil reductase